MLISICEVVMRGATTLVVAGFLLTVPSTQAQDPNVYFGNLHSHTSFSDGSGTPQEAYTYPAMHRPD